MAQSNIGYKYRFSSGEREKIEGILAWKWGIQSHLPVGHSYRNVQPTSNTCPKAVSSVVSDRSPINPLNLVVSTSPRPITSMDTEVVFYPEPVVFFEATNQVPSPATTFLAYTISGDLAEFSNIEDYVTAYDLTVPYVAVEGYDRLARPDYRIPMFLTGIDISLESNNNTYFSQNNSFKGMISGNTYPVLFGDADIHGPDNILQYATFTNPAPGYGGETTIDYTHELGDIYIPTGSSNHTVNVAISAAAHYTFHGAIDITGGGDPARSPVNIVSSQTISSTTGGRLGSFYTCTSVGSFDVGPGGDFKCTFVISDTTGRFSSVQFRGRVVKTAPAPVTNFSAGYPTGYTETFSDLSVSTYGGTKELEMIWAGPGTFMMGSPTSEANRDSDETQHEVTLTQGFYLGKYEVTQAQYESVMEGNTDGLSATPSWWPDNPDYPVGVVSWNHVQIFLTRLNEQQSENLPNGWEYALPTEAQWEYACRAGTTSAYSFGSSINSSRANYAYSGIGSGLGRTSNVGSYAANPWGFFDMHGNSYEWTADATGSYATGAVTDPFNVGTSSSNRVLRGGSFSNPGEDLRSANRFHSGPNTTGNGIGFRVALVRT